MGVRSTFADGILSISISGRFDFSAYQEFRDSYEKTADRPTRFLVDFIDVTYLDSSALGMLLLLRDFAGGDDADIRLINCNPDVRKVLTLSDFRQLFDLR